MKLSILKMGLYFSRILRDQRATAFTYLINIEFTTDIVKACVQVIEEIYDLKKEKSKKRFWLSFSGSPKDGLESCFGSHTSRGVLWAESEVKPTISLK